MVIATFKELAAAKAKVLALEQGLANELRKKLSGLPAEYGFDDVKSFIKAVKSAAGSRKAGKTKSGGKRAKRAKITPELKQKVKAAVQAGKTGEQIAKDCGISVPSVQNIKKEFGLVKKRG